MTDIKTITGEQLLVALAEAGKSQELRDAMFEALRGAQLAASSPERFRDEVRLPLITGMLAEAGAHRVRLRNGVTFEVSLDSRIERALLLSVEREPDHVWEPQTTKLLVALGRNAANVIVGGAYIGDQALLVARAMPSGVVHAFEPMEQSFAKLQRNIEINSLTNVVPRRLALWSGSKEQVVLDGDPALASSRVVDGGGIETVSIDDYVAAEGVASVELIMLDTEGGEERAIDGASELLRSMVPDVVFEIHRFFVDWSDGLPATPVVRKLNDAGYEVFAIRDYHDNLSMAGQPLELIPAADVYLEGPPHGFNMLATRNLHRIEGALDVRIVHGVSPKLLTGRDPRLHQPLPRRT
jgi:FkbM family methyltransferase